MTIDRAGNSFDTARRVALNSRSQTFRDSLSHTDRNDFYRFRLAQHSSFQMALSGLRAGANALLLNQRGQRVATAQRPGRQAEQIQQQLGAGTYYLQVSRVDGSTSYNLRMSAVPDLAGDRRNQARYLGPLGRRQVRESIGGSDRQDWYRVQVNTRSRLSLMLHRPTADLGLQLLWSNGAVLHQWPTTNHLVQQTVAPGTYFVRVAPRSPHARGAYQLDLRAAALPTPSKLRFNFTYGEGVPPSFRNALEEAGQLWSQRLTDDVQVNIHFQFDNDVAGGASTLVQYTYSQVRQALVSDRTSGRDAIALQSLPNSPALNLLMNYTSDNPNGSGSAEPYLDNDGDANNRLIRMTTANAKALGLNLAQGVPAGTFAGGDSRYDAVMLMPQSGLSGYAWDTNRKDGIASGAVDLVGILAHEIGHILGFSSGIDALDQSNTQADDQWTWVNTLDLFRYSSDSMAAGAGVRDWTVGSHDAFFSINGGTTRLSSFGTGIYHGNSTFPGHWNDDASGIMSSTLAPFLGQPAPISQTDMTALDVIGWDARTT
ncbi:MULTISPECIES: NF038122 family metalloprotease [unclassified Leptolyngbya]|uniref:NF038122 family metalloprotease n=1 Tax=unclassified Leptolyngbya TaxID=2650499 RepID=UPI001683A8A6|nr:MULTISPECIES: NF038122 family metalloprotease [unclassified Leptolyngbya]MBD1911993.1 pre-peptidase C-terminal domain-containing protein [Leptolyngbya sp. FACHB-8]MBD2155363.1 pre-peptidase C-terminal domain-containing protein [Leptolyngbya sp. FACHB-16]